MKVKKENIESLNNCMNVEYNQIEEKYEYAVNNGSMAKLCDDNKNVVGQLA